MFCVSHKSVIKGKGKGVLIKIKKYFQFAVDVFFKATFLKYDIVYVHQVSHCAIILFPLLLLMKSKLVVNFHGDDAFVQNRILRFLIKQMVHVSRLVVVPSNFMKQEISVSYPKAKNKIFVSPSGGINLNLFFSKGVRTVVNDEIVVGYFGRFDSGKGIKCLQDSLRLVKGVKLFYFIGKGEYLEDFKSYVVNTHLNFDYEFISTLPHEKLVDYFNKLDLFIYPSERESLGLIGLEALACGVPIIGSNIPGTKDYLHEGYNGFRFAVNDSLGLVQCINKYLTLPDEAKLLMHQNAKDSVKEYDVRIVSENLIKKLQTCFVS